MKLLNEIVATAAVVLALGCNGLLGNKDADVYQVPLVQGETPTFIPKKLDVKTPIELEVNISKDGVEMVQVDSKGARLGRGFYYVRIHGEHFCELLENTGYYHDEMCDSSVDWYWNNTMDRSRLREGNEKEFEEVIDSEYAAKTSIYPVDHFFGMWEGRYGE